MHWTFRNWFSPPKAGSRKQLNIKVAGQIQNFKFQIDMLQTIVRSDWINLNKYSFSNTGLSPSMANFSTMLLLKNICLFNLDSSHFARHYSGNHDRLRLKIKMQISKCKIMENHKVTIWIYIKKWAKTPSANADCCFLFLCLLRCFSSAGTHPRAARNYQFTIYN